MLFVVLPCLDAHWADFVSFSDPRGVEEERLVAEVQQNCQIRRSAQAQGSTLDDCVSLRPASSLLAVAAVNPGKGGPSNEDA